MTMLVVNGLHKTYKNNGASIRALRGADLNIEQGEFVSIMGPSGCGKSTLLHLIGGLDTPDSGEIRLDGERVDQLGETAWAKLRRKKIGYVFQSFNLIPNLNIAHNVELPMLLAGASSAEASARQAGLLDRLGIGDRGYAMPGHLSGGQQQRVAIARALANRPDLLLADEPTGNLDSKASREVIALLREFHAEGQTILLVTHDPRIASATERVIRLRDGVVASQTQINVFGKPEEALRSLITMEE